MRSRKIALYCLLWPAMVGGALLWAEPHALSQTSVMDVLHFIWSRDQILKIVSAPNMIRLAGDVATVGESRMVLGNTVIRCRFLTVFFTHDEAANGIKAVGPAGIGDRTISKVEGRGDVIIVHQHETATGGVITIDFGTGVANLTDDVTVFGGRKAIHGDRLLMDLRTGRSRLEVPKVWILSEIYN